MKIWLATTRVSDSGSGPIIRAGTDDGRCHCLLSSSSAAKATSRGWRPPLAGKSTLNRLELTAPNATAKSAYKKIALTPESVDNLFVDVFLESYPNAPEEIILDVDATDDPLHGDLEGKFFHGYYKAYCYLPLYIFYREHLLCAQITMQQLVPLKNWNV